MNFLTFLSVACGFLYSNTDNQYTWDPDALIGTCQKDSLEVTDAYNKVNARGGDDTIIDKTPGMIFMQGGSGNDQFYAGPGHDTYSGGPGRDLYIFEGNFGNDKIVDFNPYRGDRLMFIVPQDSNISFERVQKEFLSPLDYGVIIDFKGNAPFGDAKLSIFNVKVEDFDQNNLIIRTLLPKYEILD